MKDLTPKQQRFVEEYLIDLNATQAALRAGYSARTAHKQATQLLGKTSIASAIAAARSRLSKRTEITQARVLQELARIAFADVRSLFTWDEERACYVPSRDLTDDEAAAISSVEAETTRFTTDAGTETRIKLKLRTYDKKGALDSIAKHLGMFIERHEHSGPDGAPIEVREMTDTDLVDRARVQASRLTLAKTVHRNGNGNGNGAHK